MREAELTSYQEHKKQLLKNWRLRFLYCLYGLKYWFIRLRLKRRLKTMKGVISMSVYWKLLIGVLLTGICIGAVLGILIAQHF